MSGERDPVTGRFGKGNGPGKGPGWGGEAKGASTSRLAPAGDAYSDAVRALARDPKHSEAKASLRKLVLNTWVEVALHGENESARVIAADKLARRIGLPEEPTETRLTGAEGGPLAIEWRIVDGTGDSPHGADGTGEDMRDADGAGDDPHD